MPKDIDQFVNQIAVSGLVPAAELVAWMSGLPKSERPQDAEHLARELVRQKKLTRFQAEQIYAGNGKSLTLGNYLLLDKLGQGGMGLVLKAVHRRMDRIVAIKVMSKAGMKSPEAVQRFQREVKAAAKLNHPNIVAAYDADEANGTHFFVMEYVEGTNLSAFVKQHGPMPVEQAITCVLQAARGLQYAHELGVIHRDIKPANLLLAKSPGAINERPGAQSDSGSTRPALPSSQPSVVVKVLDMGLARMDDGAASQAELTTTGAVMGTVDYMAPEQALSAKSADARSDIYSLGISLWYLLTGRVAYDGDSVMAKLLAHRDAAIPSLSEAIGLMAQMPGSPESTRSMQVEFHEDRVDETCTPDSHSEMLDTVFRKMVAKRPENRYQTMAEVIRDLQGCLTGPESIALPCNAVSDSSNSDLLASAETAIELQLANTVIADTPSERFVTVDGVHSPNTDAASGARRAGGIIRRVIATAVVLTAIAIVGFVINTDQRGQQVDQPNATKENISADALSTTTNAESDVLSGATHDLISNYDLEIGVVPWRTNASGNRWTRDGSTLQFDADGQPGQIRFPTGDFVDASYCLIVEFTRTTGTNGFNIDLPLSSGLFTINLDEGDRHRSGLAKSGTYTNNFRIESGRRYRVEFTLDCRSPQNLAELKIDGQVTLSWRGDCQLVTNPHRVPSAANTKWPGLWVPAKGSSWKFHRIEITPLPLLTDPDRPPVPSHVVRPEVKSS